MKNNKAMEVKEIVDRGDIYQVWATAKTPYGEQSFDVFITKDKKYVFLGTGFLDKNGTKLNTPKELEYQKIQMAKMEEANKEKLLKEKGAADERVGKLKDAEKSALITLGSSKEKLYVFVDPECPYCKEIEKKLDVLSKRYTVYVFPFPLWMHGNATGVTYLAMQQKTNEDRYAILKKFANPATEGEIVAEVNAKGLNVGSFVTQKILPVAQKLNRGQEVAADEKQFFMEWVNGGAAVKGYNVVKSALDRGYFKSKEEIEAANNTLAAMEKAKSQGLEQRASDYFQLAETLKVRGTPTVFDTHGNTVDVGSLLSTIQ